MLINPNPSVATAGLLALLTKTLSSGNRIIQTVQQNVLAAAEPELSGGGAKETCSEVVALITRTGNLNASKVQGLNCAGSGQRSYAARFHKIRWLR